MALGDLGHLLGLREAGGLEQEHFYIGQNWLTGIVLGRRENREYLQKITAANRENVYAIRPGISEGQIPTTDVLTSLINATARRHGVEPSDLYTPSQIAEELVKEVMDSSFISSAQRAEFCGQLTQLGKTTTEVQPVEIETAVQPKTAAEYRQRLVSTISMALGVVTATMTVAFSFVDLLRRRTEGAPIDRQLELFTPVITTVLGMTVSLLMIMAYRDILRRRRRQEEVEKPSGQSLTLKVKARKQKPPESGS